MLQTYSNLIAKKTPFANLPTFTFLVILLAILALPTFAQEPVVGPLLQTKWAQGKPYNNMMVGVIRHRTGCGTTAMAQIMKHHEHPKFGIGQSEPYSTAIGTTVPSIDYEIGYDWNNMINTYNSNATQQQQDAVATLMYHAAASFKINSCSKDCGTNITTIINAMTTHFGYDKSMQRKSRLYFDDDSWEKIIREQLDAGMPVFANRTGHFYVIDGYDDYERFHFNWGWSGKHDGWYLPTVDWSTLGSGEDADFSEDDENQNIIINIKPDEGGVSPGYEIVLNSFAAQKIAAVQNEQFEVYALMKNLSPEHKFLGGQARVVLTDSNGIFVAVIGTSNMGEGSSWTRLTDRPINCTVPNTVNPGLYQLRIETRPTNGEWKPITLSAIRNGVPNSIEFSVIEPGSTGTVTFAPADGNGMVTASVDEVSIVSGGLVGLGKKVILRAIPDETHHIAGWIVNGVAVSGNTTDMLEITHIRSATTVKAIFKEKDFYYYISTYANAKEDMVVNVDKDLILDLRVSIPTPITEGATLTIRSADPMMATLTRGTTGNLFTVSNRATLILENIIIDGGAEGDFVDGTYGSLIRVYNGGMVIMENGTVLRNNVNSSNGGGVNIIDGTFTMNGGEISGNTAGKDGGGIWMSGGTFTMQDGKISDNISADGGGITLAGGTFTLLNGLVSDNTATTNGGGVRVSGGTFNMNGGEISGNSAVADGGGVRLSGGSFIMQDGKISGNTALDGGGMDVSGSSTTFTMNSGEISGNVASGRGGGMTVWSNATFNMVSGKINGNTAELDGGGVRVSSSATFTMSGGEISGNTSGTDGGGIRLTGGTFTMQDGKISGNTALDGGGMDISGSSTTFTMNGGEISGNVATRISGNTDAGRGGGMTVWSNAKFTMNGGKITGNTAGVNAGGAYVSGSNTVFTMNGGEIIGNTAPVGNGINRASGTVNLNGGVVAGTGTALTAVVSGTHNLNKGEDTPNNAAIIAWNKPAGEGPYIYEQGTSTNLIASAGATAVWQNKDGKLGIEYANGENTGFIAISESGEFITPIKIPQIAKTTIQASSANKTITLQNLPANAKIEVYNLQGKRIYSANPENPKILKIVVQTGVYIVRVNNQTLRLAVK